MDAYALSIVGIGKLGAPIAAAYASRGFRVIGMDLDPKSVEALRDGRAPVEEPGLAELLAVHRDRISATNDYVEAVLRSKVTFVVVPTPSEPDGSFSMRYVRAACAGIAEGLRRKTDYHLVVVTSTVLPGDMEAQIRPVLEAESGKRCGADFGLCYNPEFIALGTVIRDLLNPDFILIGEADARSGKELETFYRELLGSDVPIRRMSFPNAELAKISLNAFVTTKISYANMLAEICERVPGCDVDTVASAIGLDSRIGAKYLRGGLGYGGPCFPRDNLAFGSVARRSGVAPTLPEATDIVNRHQIERLASRVRSLAAAGAAVGILGLTYKPDTTIVEESQGLQLAAGLAGAGLPVVVYDPAGMANARTVLGTSVDYASSAEECIGRVSVVVIATPWEEFKRLQPARFAHNPRLVVLDCWRLLSFEAMTPVADYLSLGRHAEGAQTAASRSTRDPAGR